MTSHRFSSLRFPPLRFWGLAAFTCLSLACVPALAQSNAQGRDIETRGILTDEASGRIAPNIWSGVSRAEALLLVDSLPKRYASPTYYEVARRFLLSDAPPLPAAPETPPQKTPVDAKGNPLPASQHASDPNAPDLLIARLDKLLEMGALRDAESLYDTVVGAAPASFDLAFRSLQILMLRGEVSAACLDLQAMQARHGKSARWQELNRFCRIQFAAGAERARLAAETKFEEFPRLGAFLRGGNVGNLRTLSTEDLAFAVAAGLVNEGTVRTLTSKAGQLPPLLLAVLYQLDTDQAMPEKTCLAIEAARRGILSTRELITLYEKPHYDAALLLDNIASAPSSASVHPCMVPTVMYQRIASNSKPENRNAAIRAAMDVMGDLPDAALWPMAVYFRDFDVRAAANKKYLWRLTRILAYEKDELPAEWGQGWGAKSEKGAAVPGVSPFWPVQAIIASANQQDGAGLSAGLDTWRTQWPAEAGRVASRDPFIPLLLGQSLAPPAAASGAKTGKNPKSNLEDYENNLSLTFSRTYAMPSYGLTQRLSDVIKNNQTGQSVALLLIGYGAIPPDQVIPHQMALVIDGLNKAGLGRYARRFALEVLR